MASLSILLTGAGCSAESSRGLAKNAEWSIVVSGTLDRRAVDMLPDEAKTRFVASKNGSVYASGLLYRAGPHDHPFDRKFPEVEWVSSQALRMFRTPDQQVPSIRFALTNESPVTVKWLKLYSQDLFLVLDLKNEQRVDLAGLWWGPQSVVVDGEFVNGERFEQRSSSMIQAGVVEVSVSNRMVTVRQVKQ